MMWIFLLSDTLHLQLFSAVVHDGGECPRPYHGPTPAKFSPSRSEIRNPAHPDRHHDLHLISSSGTMAMAVNFGFAAIVAPKPQP